MINAPSKANYEEHETEKKENDNSCDDEGKEDSKYGTVH